jgi:hypothetical protein
MRRPRTAAVGAAALAVALLCAGTAGGADVDGARPPGGKGGGKGGGAPGGPFGTFLTDVPAHPVDVVAGRPTRTSVVLSVRTADAVEGCVAWQRAGDPSPRRTDVRKFGAGTPAEILLDGLAPDAAYTARFLRRATPAAPMEESEPIAFHTQRPAGAAFTFTVQADSHLDIGTDPALYERTLRNAAADAPDFHVDLGDTFMTDKRRDDFKTALPQYVAQRWYFGLVRAPVFLVLGNHDGELGWRDRGTADDMPHWSNAQRKLNFPNPEPDAFYSGNAARDAMSGLLEDWYAWEWGDAQFIVLDPFWNTRDHKGRDADGWTWSLGEAQYRWLEKTLAASRAKYRFVMIHHLVGGLDPDARGGAEAARVFEWGGRSKDGKDEFAARRPGWTAPIHELLRRAGPTVVLHGHDHFFARQELDGVVYQMVPQPGHPGGDAAKMAAEYGYVTGDFLSSPGHVRVRVAPDAAAIEYVQSSVSKVAANGTVTFSYRVAARARTGDAPGAAPSAPR